MKRLIKLATATVALITCAAVAQKAFEEYPSIEYGMPQLPPDWLHKSEWTFARLMYPPGPLDVYRGKFDGPWQEGLSLWTQNYPRADRAFANTVRRLTRIDARSVEQSVNLDDGDEIYNWPFLYAAQVGEWGLTDAQGQKLREYLLRGGFFMADNCHGSEEEAYFEGTMRKVFPEREFVDIPNDDPIFHTVVDLDQRIQVPTYDHLGVEHTKEWRAPHWRAIYDDKGRIMVALVLNSDIGGSWEHQDNPEYPLRYSDMGMRLGLNYVVYSMTH